MIDDMAFGVMVVVIGILLFLGVALLSACGLWILINAILKAIWTHGLVSLKDIFLGLLLLNIAGGITVYAKSREED